MNNRRLRQIVFATNNKHKLEEVGRMLPSDIRLLSLSDIGCHADIPETAPTLEGNALQKAQYVFDHYGMSCFADDTGLEVAALDGAPGVLSARYAGPQHDDEANKRKLLAQLQGTENRKARFRTVIAWIEKNEDGAEKGKHLFFEGIVNGHITDEERGSEGFGYDPLFVPEGYEKTFAEMGAGIKNTVSHRARAVEKFVSFLKSQQQNRL